MNEIAADGDYLWAADSNGYSLTELNASDGSWIRTLSGSKYGFNGLADIAVEGPHVWVLNIRADSVTELTIG